MRGLSPEQELVLLLRFGQSRRRATYAQVAEALGVSRREARRIEQDALRQLRMNAVDPVVEWRGWDEA